MIFSLWAPAAKSVDLVLANKRIALDSGEEGYWAAEVDAAEASGGYRYSVDGGDAFPDPRSRWQPDGVHGSSYLVDADALRRIRHSSFKPKPMADAVIYELHVGTFTPGGTYRAAQEKLPYLQDLGITHVELMPLATFPGAHGWGYDGVDLYAPLPAYGNPQDLARFIRACHDQGLAVLLDVVYNHLGPDGNYLTSYGPYFTDRVKTPWGEAINYDGPHSDGVRRFVIDNALMWLEDYGFDGLRLDAVHAIFSFEAVHVLEELAADVRALGARLGRDLVLIAESDLNDPRLVHAVERGGYALDAHWSDDFHHALHRFFTGENAGYYADFHGLDDIAAALSTGYVYQGQYSQHRQRRHGRVPDGVSPGQIVVCSQNHDQIGNRAQGERLSMLLTLQQLEAVAALTLLSPFVPLLFQGEEWGARTPFLYFTDHQDRELGRLVAEGRSREFSAFAWAGEVPNPQAPETFERSKLNWSESSGAPHAELLAWYRQLLALRARRSPAMGADGPRVEFDAGQGWLRFEHRGLLAVFNFSELAQPLLPRPGEWQVALRSAAAAGADNNPGEAGAAPAQSTTIFTKRR